VADEKTTVYLTSANGKNTFTIPRQRADRIPFWDPLLDAPAPISNATMRGGSSHADAQKAAGDSPLEYFAHQDHPRPGQGRREALVLSLRCEYTW